MTHLSIIDGLIDKWINLVDLLIDRSIFFNNKKISIFQQQQKLFKKKIFENLKKLIKLTIWENIDQSINKINPSIIDR